ncbi:MAG: hypothetical protein RR590_00445 [Hungatella sp.]
MKRICGLMIFCVGVGMALMVFIHTTLTALVVIIGCLVLGYNLFCHC